MDTIGKRLAYFIEKEGFTRKSFCEKFDFDYNAFVMILVDKRTLGIATLKKLKDALPYINVEWLLFDHGKMNLDDGSHTGIVNNVINEPEDSYKIADPVDDMFIKYLKRKKVQAELKKIYDSFNKM